MSDSEFENPAAPSTPKVAEPEATALQTEDPFTKNWMRLRSGAPNVPVMDVPHAREKFTIGDGSQKHSTIAHYVPKAGIAPTHCIIARGPLAPDGTCEVKVSKGHYKYEIYIDRVRVNAWPAIIRHGQELALVDHQTALMDPRCRFTVLLNSTPIPISSSETISHRYESLGRIGKGCFGAVYKMKSKLTGQVVAVKFVNKRLVEETAGAAVAKTLFERELATMHALIHFYIVRNMESLEDESSLYIVMEYVDGGDLAALIKNQVVSPEATVQEWAAQGVDALEYMHGMLILHRDIKPANIVLDLKTNSIKFVDLGLARFVDKAGPQDMTVLGTLAYLAPEIMRGKEYDAKVDCYSFGVVLFCLLVGKAIIFDLDPPSISDSPRDKKKYVLQRKVQWDLLKSQNVSQKCTNFLQKMIVKRPARRMSSAEARQHEWIRDIPTPQESEESGISIPATDDHPVDAVVEEVEEA